MKGKWKVTSNLINGKKMYSVFRIKNTNEVDHSGNREYVGPWVNNKETAVIAAEELNKKTEEGDSELYK